jgi:ferredoxin
MIASRRDLLCIAALICLSILPSALGFGLNLPFNNRLAAVGCSLSSSRHGFTRPHMLSSSSSSDEESSSSSSSSEDTSGDGRIDLSLDDRLYRIRLPRAPGIEWGTDLSFSFVYIREMDPSGPASMSGLVEKGDQLCELIPVTADADAAAVEPVNLLGAGFDFVMSAFATLDKTTRDVDLVFFKGTKEELKAVCTGEEVGSDSDTITVTVIQNKGAPDESVVKLKAPAGVNLRQLLVDNGINVYQSVTRWTNCKGKQLCGTCIVNMAEGIGSTNWKSMDEASTLRENPESYRLSCVTFAHGDITVETFPPVSASQWTR